jgi:hypothetical protein
MDLTHDRLADGGPRYTETPADPYARFPAEPRNAVPELPPGGTA